MFKSAKFVLTFSSAIVTSASAMTPKLDGGLEAEETRESVLFPKNDRPMYRLPTTTSSDPAAGVSAGVSRGRGVRADRGRFAVPRAVNPVSSASKPVPGRSLPWRHLAVALCRSLH